MTCDGIILVMTTIHIAGFAGSLRKSSFNQQMLERAAVGAREEGAEVDLVDLGAFDLPIFHDELAEGESLPEGVLALKGRLRDADGLLIASPEYNCSVTPLLKNVLDWCSVPTNRENPDRCLEGKHAGVMATSPGRLGGIRGLFHLRDILMDVGVHPINHQYALPGSHQAFAEDGSLVDERMDETLLKIGRELVRVSRALKSS